jgi:PAS domain S-box-containing protein
MIDIHEPTIMKPVKNDPLPASSDNSFHKVLSLLNHGVVITDEDGYIDWMNRSMIENMGYPLDEALGHKPISLFQGKATEERHKRQFRSKLKKEIAFSQEIVIHPKIGRKRLVNFQVSPVRNVFGEIEKHIWIETDISKLVKNRVNKLNP